MLRTGKVFTCVSVMVVLTDKVNGKLSLKLDLY